MINFRWAPGFAQLWRRTSPIQCKKNPTFLTHPYSSQPLNSLLIDDSTSNQHISLQDDPLIHKNHGVNPKSQSTKIRRSSIVTFNTIKEFYRNQIPITMLTAYDFATARLVGMSASSTDDQTESKPQPFPIGVDICLCGDSLANVCLGYQSTTELGFQEFAYHVQSVRRGLDSISLEPNSRTPLLIADLPFGSFESSIEQGVQAATKLIQASRVDGFKIEGGQELSPLIQRLTSFGIPVIGHIGLTPQRASGLGGFKVQGHDDSSKARQIIQDAINIQASGCIAIVIEAVPVEIVKELKKHIQIPLIGIGAGPETDGQVLVLSDLIGILASSKKSSSRPKFIPDFSDQVYLPPNSRNLVFDVSTQLIQTFIHQVRTRQFPVLGTHTYAMKPNVLTELNQNGWLN